MKNCAKFIIKLIERDFSGIYNLGARNSISKEKFALAFFKKMKVQLNLVHLTSQHSNREKEVNKEHYLT